MWKWKEVELEVFDMLNQDRVAFFFGKYHKIVSQLYLSPHCFRLCVFFFISIRVRRRIKEVNSWSVCLWAHTKRFVASSSQENECFQYMLTCSNAWTVGPLKRTSKSNSNTATRMCPNGCGYAHYVCVDLVHELLYRVVHNPDSVLVYAFPFFGEHSVEFCVRFFSLLLLLVVLLVAFCYVASLYGLNSHWANCVYTFVAFLFATIAFFVSFLLQRRYFILSFYCFYRCVWMLFFGLNFMLNAALCRP